MRPQPELSHHFKTTLWSLVHLAQSEDADHARQALGKLIDTYWFPLYAFARRKGHGDPDAMDLTQGFFALLLESDAIDKTSPEKGRFRSFLLASFTHFIANQRRLANAQKRGNGTPTISLSAADFDARYHFEPSTDESADVLFERAWVNSLLDAVRRQLAAEYATAGKSELFSLLEPHMTETVDALPREQISRQLKLSSAALSMSLYRMRRRFGELLRQEIAATVDDPADVDSELNELMSIVSRPGMS